MGSFDTNDPNCISRTDIITLKFKMRWFRNEGSYSAEKLLTDINLLPLLSDKDKNFGVL